MFASDWHFWTLCALRRGRRRNLDTHRLRRVDAAASSPHTHTLPPAASQPPSQSADLFQTTQTLTPAVRRTNTHTQQTHTESLYLATHKRRCCDAFLIWIINYTSRRPSEPQNAERSIYIRAAHSLTHSYTWIDIRMLLFRTHTKWDSPGARPGAHFSPVRGSEIN